jgi:hypothetical protein
MPLPPMPPYPPNVVTDTSDAYEWSGVGIGPFPAGGVLVVPPNPLNLGYGGSAYGYLPYGSVFEGPGGSKYGMYPPPNPYVTGGYGGYAYGFGPYGTERDHAPYLTSLICIDGYHIEVFFSEDMVINADLVDPASYILHLGVGASTHTFAITTVTPNVLGTVGATSVILTHSGTTLGGNYTLEIIGPIDSSGNRIEDYGRNTYTFIARGDAPTYTVVPISGTELVLTFQEDMVETSEFIGIEEVSSYDFDATYPIILTPITINHPYTGDLKKVYMEVQGMTSLNYTTEISPSLAIGYDGTYLPSSSISFTGTEVGAGTSSINAYGLSLGKELGDVYGWSFEDLSGRIGPARTFRVDFSLGFYQRTTVTPALYNTSFGLLQVNDGAVELAIYVERLSGIDVLTLTSGAYTKTVAANWSTTLNPTISLIRNELAQIYVLLFDGEPLISESIASMGGVPSIVVGAQFILSNSYKVENFIISDIVFTSTNTVFSTSWNFLHSIYSSFTGSAANTKDIILTQKGPLVKDWGNAVPATKNDVQVYVNGVSVDILDVNPYFGLIQTVVPIPLMPLGTLTVKVDYTWFPKPVFEMAGLNTLGLVLNKWDLAAGRDVTSPPTSELGGFDNTSRFQMGLVLGPMTRRAPKYIGHRYIGFEKEYTASLNSPTTLTFNQNPHSVAKDYFQETPDPVSISYEATETPITSDPLWTLEGQDTGHLNSDGTYTLIDSSAGSYGTGLATVYYRNEDLSFDSSTLFATRFYIEDYTLNGVFTGVGFGIHNNRRLFLVGALEVNGVKHVGFLSDIARPEKRESWIIGPSFEISIIDSTSFTVNTGSLPVSLEPGDRFQIFDGGQAGVYEILSIVTPPTCSRYYGSSTVTLDSSTPFPMDPDTYGNKSPTIYFEVNWTDPTIFRLVALPQEGSAQLFISGEISSSMTVSNIYEVAMASQDVLLLSTNYEGQVFWGSLIRECTNTSTWSFVRYGINPTQTTFSSRGVVVSSEFNVLPENDPNSEWFNTENFGYCEVDSTFNRILLKSSNASSSINLSFGYSRVEPFLVPTRHLDLDAKFQVEDGTLGHGDALIVVNDTNREIRLGTLLYNDPGLGFSKTLETLSQLNISSLYVPEDEGWSKSATFSINSYVNGDILYTTQTLGQTGFYNAWYSSALDVGSRTIEGRFAVTSYTVNASNETGIFFGGESGLFPNFYVTYLTLLDNPPRVAVLDGTTVVQTYSFDWTDGDLHTYRLILDYPSLAVSVVIDDVAQLPVLDLSTFTSSTNNAYVYFGSYCTNTICTVEWKSLCAFIHPHPSLKRTIGVWIETLDTHTTPFPKNDFRAWKIPRTDGLNVPNDNPLAVIEEMDWRNPIEVRIHRDVNWGVVVLRPDLPPPPYYSGDFVTDITEPTAGWISVEYPQLPRVPTLFGSVSWGSLDPESITQQRWDFLRYNIYESAGDDYSSAHHMVYNQFNVINSGELLKDITPETVIVNSLSSTLVSLKPTHIYANDVYRVLEGSTPYLSTQWSFDKDSQSIFMSTPLSGDSVPVTVIFMPGKPVTDTYLLAQPVLKSMTLLNEGTPPIPKNQTIDSVRTVTFGSQLNDPNDVLNIDPDFIINDPFRYVSFIDSSDAVYETMTFYEVEDSGTEGLITTYCDDTFSDHGLLNVGFSGFSEQFTFTKGTTYSTFVMGGGARVTSSRINSSALLGSNNSTFLGGGRMFINITSTIIIDALGTEVNLEELFGFVSSATLDNTPPSYSLDYLNMPNGVAGIEGHGACLAVISTPTTHSKIGPNGGVPTLNAASLLYGVSGSQPYGVPSSGLGLTMFGGVAITPPTLTILNIESAN